MQHCDSDGQMMLFSLEEADEIYARPPKRKSGTLTLSTLISIPYFHLDLSKGHVDLFGCHYWEFRSPWQENGPPLNTGAAPREPVKCDLSSILERDPDERHDLSPKACLGTLHRAKERGKPLPERLEWALMAQAGLLPMNFQAAEMRAYHINRRDEDTDLYGVAGTLMATSNMQMQTFINGDSVVFAANQREKVNCRKAAREATLGREVRDLHDLTGALQAQPGMKQQTFVAGFSAGAGAKAGSIGYSEKISPTLKGTASGNCMPSRGPCGLRSTGINPWCMKTTASMPDTPGHTPLPRRSPPVRGPEATIYRWWNRETRLTGRLLKRTAFFMPDSVWTYFTITMWPLQKAPDSIKMPQTWYVNRQIAAD